MTEEQEAPQLRAGVYAGKLINYGITETKEGKPQPTMVFEVEDGEHKHNVFWRGSLNEGRAREITLESLFTCGLQTADLAAIAEGPEGKALKQFVMVSVTVEIESANEPDENGNIKTWPRVKWVNTLGGMKYTMSKDDAVKKIGGLNLKADVAQMAQKLGITLKSGGARRQPGGAVNHDTNPGFNDAPPPDDTDIPF